MSIDYVIVAGPIEPIDCWFRERFLGITTSWKSLPIIFRWHDHELQEASDERHLRKEVVGIHD